MNTRTAHSRTARSRIATLLAAALATAAPAGAQVAEPIIIFPPAPRPILLPRPLPAPPPVALTRVDASIAINDQAAATTLVLTLTNSGHVQQEARVLLPVPDGAAVRAFQLDSLGPEPTATILPRDEARRIYNQIVSASKDPGLLEFAGGSFLRSSVFPVPPGGTQTVRLTYEHILTTDSTQPGSLRLDYTLPRSESIAPAATIWTINADVRSARPISTVYSPTHELVIDRPADDPNRAILRVAGTPAAGPFRLSALTTAPDATLATTLFLYPDPESGGGYFMLVAAPPPRAPGSSPAITRELTIVLDRSGSMRGEKIDQAKEAALQVVEGLAPGERFTIVDYSDSINTLFTAPTPKDDRTIALARDYINAITPGGGTNIHDALLEALRPAPAPGTLPVVLFLTDGLPTIGITAEAPLRDAIKAANTANRRLFTFGVGVDLNAPLLTAVARDSRAAPTFVLPRENVEVAVGQVFQRLRGPILTSPTLTAAGPVSRLRETLPATLPDVFTGEQIVVLGRYTAAEPGPIALTLAGQGAAGPVSVSIPLDPAHATARHAFVPRLWATRRVASLIEQIRLAGAGSTIADPKTDPRTKELVDEIVQLSIRWGILTEYTAFLALEPEHQQRLRAAMDALPSSIPGSTRYEQAASKVAGDELAARASARSGAGGVNQEMNAAALGRATTAAPRAQTYLDKDLREVRLASVQQINRRTFYQRGPRLVDAQLLYAENDPPETTIAFGSPEYQSLADELIAQGDAGVLALNQDVYLLHNARRMLVQAAPAR